MSDTRSKNAKGGKQNPQRSNFAERVLNHRQVARASLNRLLGAPASTLLTVTVIATALLFPALLAIIDTNLQAGMGDIESTAKLTVFMESTASEAEITDVSNYLHTMEGLVSITFVSAEQAREMFGRSSGLAELLDDLPDNPLPASFVLSPDSTDISNLDELVNELQPMDGVDFIQLDRLWIQRVQAFSELLTAFNWVLMLAVGAGLLAIVGNTIRLAIEHRRQEIRVIKLIGGSDSYIARPFLYTGLFLGLAGGIAAGLLVTVVALYMAGTIATLSQLYGNSWQLQGLGVSTYLLLALTGSGIGWGAALIASYRNIGTIEP